MKLKIPKLIFNLIILIILFILAFTLFNKTKNENGNFNPINDEEVEYTEINDFTNSQQAEFYLLFSNSNESYHTYFIDTLLKDISYNNGGQVFDEIYLVDIKDLDSIDLNNIKNTYKSNTFPFIIKTSKLDGYTALFKYDINSNDSTKLNNFLIQQKIIN